MKNLRPFEILLVGTVVVVFSCFFGLLVLRNNFSDSGFILVLFSVLIGVVTYLTFYFLIKKFITEKVKILYRSIRKGKFTNENEQFSLYDDIIENAEKEAKIWAEQQTREISKLREQAEFRREFIGNLAHELKTPVFSIQGYILTLLEGGLEDETVNRSFLERASKATDRMTSILEDLDTLTKMEVDALNLEMNKFDLVELVRDVFEEFEIKAKKKKIKLKLSKQFDPIFVHADRNKISQVLTNLISNSITYGTDGGETTIRFYILEDIITIEVSDNGPGIGDKDLPRIFERFYRVEKSRNRNEGGSGLGLAIVKKIVESHGQTISVRSTLGVGSTFTFSLDKWKNTRK